MKFSFVKRIDTVKKNYFLFTSLQIQAISVARAPRAAKDRAAQAESPLNYCRGTLLVITGMGCRIHRILTFLQIRRELFSVAAGGAGQQHVRTEGRNRYTRSKSCLVKLPNSKAA